MLARDILPADVMGRVRHVMPISPVSDLWPLLKTKMNADFQLDEAEAKAESPVFQGKPDVPVTVWVGANERPAFLDQARWLVEAWECDHVVEDGKHHFDIINALVDPGSDMVQIALRD
jgi:hypothetical protein